jgi:hypothetical protein
MGVTLLWSCTIWGFHSHAYEECHLVGCRVMWVFLCLSKSWKLHICSLKKLSGSDTRCTRLCGHTPLGAPILRLSKVHLVNLPLNTPSLTYSYTCSGKPLATCCFGPYITTNPITALCLSCNLSSVLIIVFFSSCGLFC